VIIVGDVAHVARLCGFSGAPVWSTVIQQKLLFTKQDELGIVLLGTDETENELNQEDAESYQHVSIFQPLQKPDLRLLESIKSDNAAHSRTHINM
jgi:hypothetical protein